MCLLEKWSIFDVTFIQWLHLIAGEYTAGGGRYKQAVPPGQHGHAVGKKVFAMEELSTTTDELFFFGKKLFSTAEYLFDIIWSSIITFRFVVNEHDVWWHETLLSIIITCLLQNLTDNNFTLLNFTQHFLASSLDIADEKEPKKGCCRALCSPVQWSKMLFVEIHWNFVLGVSVRTGDRFHSFSNQPATFRIYKIGQPLQHPHR